jgi:hypothetical protein
MWLVCFCVKFYLKCKKDGFEWALIAVYVDAQDANKPAFLPELVCICESKMRHMLVGGDFNIIKLQEEKMMILM